MIKRLTAKKGNDPTIHASAVEIAGRGLLILGPSGSGKSSLALALMGMGARLVADDRVILRVRDSSLVAECPAPIRGRIEARGIGLLQAEAAGPVAIAQVVDLGQAETRRLPPPRSIMLSDLALPLVLGPAGPHLAPALMQLMRGGRG
ncbi:HPr kinase/phosphorylase [Paracoccus sp. MC1862]|uniref:HPr kinase/phosphorylase n=1 Tax=Paracoccus sp. MC1862 TaxID=2760307 RepID=UPI0015FEEE2E|nr:HPr kinase/phosphatase C-terminal domain-containing protein [Paracoccus sp. MC1862]MBB1496685.1 HPr kinase/phosphatase C-terminal domain-containing protein [Paracoccus sp. MC1862]QQO43695.1 HPr kinase/phosphatase C-terminal domain-containing protein [Paracoccus sp. MC1862]